MNTFMTTQFVYTLDPWMFHSQKTKKYINSTHKNTFENCEQRS